MIRTLIGGGRVDLASRLPYTVGVDWDPRA